MGANTAQVLPQLIARINVGEPAIRESLHSLLLRVGLSHPQVCAP